MEKPIVLFSIFVLLLFSCKKENKGDCIKSHGAETTQFIDLKEYSIIKIKGHVNVTIKPNQNTIAEITGGKNVLPLIQCEVIDDTLFIDNTNTCNWVRSYDREVSITLFLDLLDGIVNGSTGKLTSTDTIHSKTFTLVGQPMNGETSLSLSANQLNFNYLDGTSTVYLSGQVNTANYYYKSLGYIDATDLITNETIINHRGTGDISVFCTNYLLGTISKTGDVYYLGNPKTIKVETLSSGELIQK
ncbi:MAG: DUF2807 domain-containing protein [Flavobacteriales bacterium]|nr:DUF2807 domain-containing protein [Flavobacteriales bacterium]